MIDRYAKDPITEIWSDLRRLELWQAVEMAAIEAKEDLGLIPQDTHAQIFTTLRQIPFDLAWWKNRDNEIHHDLQAAVDERRQHLPVNLQAFYHGDEMTSYDTEEPAFSICLQESIQIVRERVRDLLKEFSTKALLYRYTIMMGHTHGQGAEVQSFGCQNLTWHADTKTADHQLERACDPGLEDSKMSGAIGNYGGMDPKVEIRTLEILKRKPYYGATQIMPRVIYSPIANALADLVSQLSKVAGDIRLGARSVLPLYREPFKKKQTGSSAMPHKKNPIRCEQMEGMARMARAFAKAIQECIETWEQRAIEQSCVERVCWPGLFHVTVHCLETMTKIIAGLKVYPDNMLREVIELRGCHASAKAKDVLKRHGLALGLTAEDAYRIVQLASFQAFRPNKAVEHMRTNPPQNLEQASQLYITYATTPVASTTESTNIRDLILNAKLETLPDELECDQKMVARWNGLLLQLFSDDSIREEWLQSFVPANLLRGEDTLYKMVLAA